MILHAHSAPTWEPLAPLPEPNCGFIAGDIGGNIVIAGGTNWTSDRKHWLDRIWLYEPSRNTWREAGRLAAPLAYAAFGADAQGIWFAGGSSGAETHTALSLLDRKLVVKNVIPGAPRTVYAASAMLDGILYVIGGAPAQDAHAAIARSCFALDLRTHEVAPLADLPVPGFAIGTAAACDGRIFVFGGSHWDAAAGEVANMAGAFAWSPKEKRWSTLTPYPFPARGIASAVLDSSHIYIAGGYKNDTEEFTDQGFLFDTKTGTFRPSTPLPLRAMVSLVVAGDYVYCLGGEDRKKHRTDAAFRIRWKELLSP